MEDEVTKFNKLGLSWWDPNGPMSVLHAMNGVRVPFIRQGILRGHSDPDIFSSPLSGYTVLDVGSGGGFLSEALGKEGATVIGIDPGEENVKVATNHLSPDLQERVSYQCITVDYFAKSNPGKLFDAVVISEVIEHVDNPETFLEAAIGVLKEGGSIILTTPNRTIISWIAMILFAEHILRILPVGTHSWNKFITPKELKKMLKKYGCQVQDTKGFTYNPLIKRWSQSCFKPLYAIHAIKKPLNVIPPSIIISC